MESHQSVVGKQEDVSGKMTRVSAVQHSDYT